MKNKNEEFVKKALNKMFTYVGFDGLDEEFTKQDQWYNKKTWTQEQSNEFKKWFINEFKKDLKFKKNMAEREYAWFDVMWGWKIEK
jgi:hypothetical protein